MRITALQPQVRNPERINIFVDGQFLLGAHALIVLQMGLSLDQEISHAQLEQLQWEENVQQAVDRAFNYISLRPRSRQEVRNYLRRKETPAELIESVLQRLDNLDLVNDHEFASFWVETREHFSPRGARALRQELRSKGVEREVVDELVDEEQDEERALRSGRKKAFSLINNPGVDYNAFRTRLGSFLQRRGFSYSIAAQTVRTLWEELKGERAQEDEQEPL
ncbi:hypothetical protein EPA93_30010 [Ktedonosporobacter rubrisoli]|uniref:Regulatory protein RecX n=1 Tax=Ktedonosporobacter rubrisoli TaxID=2509675 RepID=A0A4P6JWC7_KTERU|nr:RecX family transcriptional regulator [Ktedonosporobacter rubrisoli]QBD79989.1 hypothetical protein EPA93_30010 [Ktedonosporobacter rubrisoli]